MNTFYDDGDVQPESHNYTTMFDYFKLDSKFETNSNKEQTMIEDSKTSTSSAFSEHEDESKIIEDVQFEKDFLAKKRRRRVKKYCKNLIK